MKTLLIALCLLCLTAGQARAELPRLLPLGSPCVEIIFALGLGDQVIGRAGWDLWPPQILDLPSVGDPAQPNLELILQLKPDLIVADENYSAMFSRLRRFDFEVLTVSAYNTHQAIPAVLELAKQLGVPEQGNELAVDLQEVLDLIAERTAQLTEHERAKALFLTGTANAYYSVSSLSGWSLFDLAGVRNLAADLPIAFPSVSREWLTVLDPDLLVLAPMSTLLDRDNPGAALGKIWQDAQTAGPLADSRCVREGNFMVIDDLLTFGPRSVFGALLIACRAYPELFADIDPQAWHQAFTRKYFGLHDRQTHFYP